MGNALALLVPPCVQKNVGSRNKKFKRLDRTKRRAAVNSLLYRKRHNQRVLAANRKDKSLSITTIVEVRDQDRSDQSRVINNALDMYRTLNFLYGRYQTHLLMLNRLIAAYRLAHWKQLETKILSTPIWFHYANYSLSTSSKQTLFPASHCNGCTDPEFLLDPLQRSPVNELSASDGLSRLYHYRAVISMQCTSRYHCAIFKNHAKLMLETRTRQGMCVPEREYCVLSALRAPA